MTGHGQKKRRFWHTGITRHSGAVALSPARALTSHLRHWFFGRYKGKYRLAKAVFAFDLFLAALAVGLMVFNIVILFRFSYFGDCGLELLLNADSLKASDAAPLKITVRARDGKTHRDVSLRWKFPEWVEILRAEPRLDAEGRVFFGSLKPGEEKTTLVYVRFRALKDTEVPIAFTLHQFDALGFYRDQTGFETRKIQDVSLRADPAVQARYFSRGALLPILVHNKSSLKSEAVTLEMLSEPGLSRVRFLSDQELSAGGQRAVIGDLEPGAKKVVYVVLPSDQETVRLKWDLLERSHAVYQNYIRYDVSTGTAAWSQDDLGLEVSGGKLVLHNPAKRSGEVFIDHPGLAERNFITMPLSPTTTANGVMLENAASTSSRRWTAIVVENKDGGVIGPAGGGYLNSLLPLKTFVRYFTDLGDQIGVGPLPPQVGVTTTYWAVWDLGPLEYGLKDVRLETILPSGVTATGRNSSEFGGEFMVQDSLVIWTLPQGIPASPNVPVKLSFEISFMPTPDMTGKVIQLIGLSKVSGKDRGFGGDLMSEKIQGDDTRLESDARAKGQGMVEPRQ